MNIDNNFANPESERKTLSQLREEFSSKVVKDAFLDRDIQKLSDSEYETLSIVLSNIKKFGVIGCPYIDLEMMFEDHPSIRTSDEIETRGGKFIRNHQILLEGLGYQVEGLLSNISVKIY